MPKAYVLMTALPPTKGHLHLIQYAAHLAESAEVIVCTQPSEPWAFERVAALREATRSILNVNIHHIHKELPQEPEVAVGFWDMWLDFLLTFGLQPEDYIVASEMYGQKLAEISGATFMPYDIDRSIMYTKATDVRRDPLLHFDDILPSFQHNMQMTVTTFGAESCGKTTLARNLADHMYSYWLFEWARPYLETVGSEVTNEKMAHIWAGQKALQEHGRDLYDKPFIFQDTDLFSTVGYWEMWDKPAMPDGLVKDAIDLQSDLYLICQSNIPFEADPLRYGGDERESPDQYWIDLCERFDLPYYVVQSNNEHQRVLEVSQVLTNKFNANKKIDYTRLGQ